MNIWVWCLCSVHIHTRMQHQYVSHQSHLLTLNELYHLLMGHGGHQRAVDLEVKTTDGWSVWRKQWIHVWWEKAGRTFMIRSPSWTPALTAAPPSSTNICTHNIFQFSILYHMFCWFQIGKHVHGGFSEHFNCAGVSPSRTCCTSLTLSPQTVKPKPSWSFCTTTHRWTRPGPGERWSREVTNNRQTWMGRKIDPESQLPVLSTEMSGVSSLCCAAEDLRSESPMVRLLSLCLGDIRERLSTRRLIQKTLWNAGRTMREWRQEGSLK